MALENSRRKAPPPRPKEDPEKESLLDRRKMVSVIRKLDMIVQYFSQLARIFESVIGLLVFFFFNSTLQIH